MNLRFIFLLIIGQITFSNTVLASDWNIEMQEDGTCALGKVYDFGKRDAVIIVINSYGSITLASDNEFNGKVSVDGGSIIEPVNKISDGIYVYSNGDNKSNQMIFVNKFMKGNVATIILNNGNDRNLKLNGFTRAYKKYVKCAR